MKKLALSALLLLASVALADEPGHLIPRDPLPAPIEQPAPPPAPPAPPIVQPEPVPIQPPERGLPRYCVVQSYPSNLYLYNNPNVSIAIGRLLAHNAELEILGEVEMLHGNQLRRGVQMLVLYNAIHPQAALCGEIVWSFIEDLPGFCKLRD